ncbi:MAG: PAS domain S-box protein [Trichocoleus desertorum ATA4-8-CV12]|jgi:PAS domain S-box-containing protein|nr:PAS domain S-box protein [Trichocoleus desertorum ATA4-8-CV12]
MSEFLETLLVSSGFIPHGHCYLWKPGLVGLHLVSDALIALSYYSIPLMLVYFVRKRRDIPFDWIFWMFGLFIVACGTTHVINIWTLWHPVYWLAGLVKAITALASVGTAASLFYLLPQALALTSPAQLAAVNLALSNEVVERKQAEAHVQTLNAELEQRVSERAAALIQSNERLKSEIAERSRVETELRRSLKELSDIKFALDKAAIVATTDQHGTINYVNDKFCELSKYSRAELLGQNHRIINSGHHSALFFEVLWATISSGKVWHGEIQNRAKDGSYYWVDTTIVPFLDQAGHPFQYLAIRFDMTERKQAEVALRNSRERFRLLVEGVQDYAIIMLSAEGQVASWNSGAARIMGYQAPEIIGQSVSRFYPDVSNSQAKAQQEIQIATTTGRFEEEGWRMRQDGSQFWAHVILTALNDGTGQLRGFSKVTRDITDRRRAEQEIKALNQELEQRVTERTTQLAAINQELEAFAYSVSHDLRAPLRSIDGFSQTLLERHAEQLDAKGQHYLQRVRAGTQRMGQLIDDLLNLSRVTRSEMSWQPVDLSAIAQSIATELQQSPPERQVELAIAPDLMAYGDTQLLTIVLDNLLRNAWKFTSKHSQAWVELGALPSADTPIYFVRDDGTGFDMEYAHKLFGAFQRLHAMTEFPGTGIGLATVQRIIHRHGGKVWAEGAVEQGACFYFTLSPKAERNLSSENQETV